MSNTSVIKIEGVSKRYKVGRRKTSSLRDRLAGLFSSKSDTSHNFWALNDISLEIESGQIVGLIGRNGAGKSTLLKILSKITPPTHGQITIDGRIASLLEVGTGFHAELTGYENIFLNGTLLGMSRSEVKRKLDQIIAFAGIDQFIHTPVKHYSSGMYVRLAFSVAAHLEPEILIVDEVLAVGDVDFQKKCIGKMEEVSRIQGRTILFVSHNLASLKALCNRGIVLSHGSLSFDGGIIEAVSSYLNPGTDNEVDRLEDLNQHLGTMEIIVKRIVVSGKTDVISVGDTLIINMSYEILKKNHNFNGCHISVNVYDEQQLLIFTHNSRMVGRSFSHQDFESGDTIEFKLNAFPFRPGKYSLSYNVVDQNRFMDSMEHAKDFEVHPGLAYNYVQEFNAGISAVDGDWQIN